MARKRKWQLWLDDSAGSLTDYTDDLNSLAVQLTSEVLDDTGLNADDRTIVMGLKTNAIPIGGYYNDTTVSQLYDALRAAQGTSVSKTFQVWLQTGVYLGGECYPANVELTGDGKALRVFTSTLEVSDAVTKTSINAA